MISTPSLHGQLFRKLPFFFLLPCSLLLGGISMLTTAHGFTTQGAYTTTGTTGQPSYQVPDQGSSELGVDTSDIDIANEEDDADIDEPIYPFTLGSLLDTFASQQNDSSGLVISTELGAQFLNTLAIGWDSRFEESQMYSMWSPMMESIYRKENYLSENDTLRPIEKDNIDKKTNEIVRETTYPKNLFNYDLLSYFSSFVGLNEDFTGDIAASYIRYEVFKDAKKNISLNMLFASPLAFPIISDEKNQYSFDIKISTDEASSLKITIDSKETVDQLTKEKLAIDSISDEQFNSFIIRTANSKSYQEDPITGNSREEDVSTKRDDEAKTITITKHQVYSVKIPGAEAGKVHSWKAHGDNDNPVTFESDFETTTSPSAEDFDAGSNLDPNATTPTMPTTKPVAPAPPTIPTIGGH